MELYFLRHGEADWPDWKKSDDERPLTKRGKKEMHEVAAFLVRLKVQPDLILTSPLPRAAQTAEIAAEHLNVKCREEQRLAPGFGAAELEQIINKHSVESLMIVGHEPDFTRTIARLDRRIAETFEGWCRPGRCRHSVASRPVALALPAQDRKEITVYRSASR